MNDLRRTGRLDLLPRVLPVLAAGMAVNGFGELLGYTLGTGRARETKFDLESRRGRFMIEADRRDLLDPHRSFARITL